jgi:hypothetical protein
LPKILPHVAGIAADKAPEHQHDNSTVSIDARPKNSGNQPERLEV